MSIIQLLLRIHTNDFFSLSPYWFSKEGSPQLNLTANTCFPLSGSDLPVT